MGIKMTREELDESWNEIRRRLKQVNPVKIVASLFARVAKVYAKEYDRKGFPADRQILHIALHRLKEKDERYAEMLKDFIFITNTPAPFPFSSEFQDAIPRLMMAGRMWIPSPDYDRIVVTKKMQDEIAKEEEEWHYAPDQRNLLDEMGREFARLIKEEDKFEEERMKDSLVRE